MFSSSKLKLELKNLHYYKQKYLKKGNKPKAALQTNQVWCFFFFKFSIFEA